MKILNLVDIDKSDIKYQKVQYPDSQQNIIIDYKSIYTIVEPPNGFKIFNPIKIKTRLNNFIDLELLICSVKSLRELGVKEIHLYTPYFLGSRSDRKFEEGSCNYLKDVICPIINSLNFESVTVIDGHSDVLEACLNNYKKLSNLDLVRWVFMNHPQNTKPLSDFILVSPDSGASKKIYKLAEQIGYKGDIITCSKERDKDGKLSKCVVPFSLDYKHKDIIIIDDILDKGNTFINIAKEVKKLPYFRGNIYLVVTHGLFTGGFEELAKYFKNIYCTNSYIDLKDVDSFDTTDMVKQLDVF